MVTLQENAVKFNDNLIVSHDGGRLSSDSGLVLIEQHLTHILPSFESELTCFFFLPLPSLMYNKFDIKIRSAGVTGSFLLLQCHQP